VTVNRRSRGIFRLHLEDRINQARNPHEAGNMQSRYVMQRSFTMFTRITLRTLYWGHKRQSHECWGRWCQRVSPLRLLLYSQLVQPPVAYVVRSEVFVSRESLHVVTTTNIPCDRQARRVEYNIWTLGGGGRLTAQWKYGVDWNALRIGVVVNQCYSCKVRDDVMTTKTTTIRQF
jgi:hypothetical protein